LIAIALLTFGLIGYAFYVVNEKSMQIKYDIQRTRVLKTKASGGTAGASILKDRQKENLQRGLW